MNYTVIFLLLTLAIIYLVILPAYAEHTYGTFIPEKEVTWTTGCLYMVVPELYCKDGTRYVVIQLNATNFPDPDDQQVRGWSVIGPYPIAVDSKYSLCMIFPQFIRVNPELCVLNYVVFGTAIDDGCFQPMPCMPVLWHEIKHLKCDCNWHEDLKQRTIKITIQLSSKT